MEILHIILVSIGSLIALLILTKLMGNRQVAQLSLFDYVIGITIGSIAAEMATSLEDDFAKPLTAMIVYAVFAVLFSLITNKCIFLRRHLTGKTLILFDNGKLYRSNLKKAHLDLGEFLCQCRNSGYFSLADIQTAVFEPNGKISFLPTSQSRPVQPSDLNLNPPKTGPEVNVIVDGNILLYNLRYTGNDEIWLKKELHAQNADKISDIFLATCDCSNTLHVYKRIDKSMSRDIFQ